MQRNLRFLLSNVVWCLPVMAACTHAAIEHAARVSTSVGDLRVRDVSWAPARERAYRGGAAGSRSTVDLAGAGRFWAYTNRATAYVVSARGDDGVWRPWATLSVPRNSLLRRADGSGFDLVDSVEITITPDPAALRVDLEPSGLVFNPIAPARLTLSYADGEADLNRDGRVDADDDYVSQVLLQMRTRQHVADAWAAVPSTNDVLGRQLSADLRHFTSYGISW